jgi:glucokinase
MTEPRQLIQERLADNRWGILGSQGHVLGIDLGGYGIRVALVDLQNHTYTSVHTPCERENPEAIIATTIALTHTLLKDSHVPASRLVRVGIGFGSPIDPHKGTVLLSPRMSEWHNRSLKNTFEQAFDTVTLVDNDANLIAFGEATFGIGYGCPNLFYLHLSSGVGGGIVLDGRIHHGANALAGEVGHVIAEKSAANPQGTATLENLVSLTGLLQRAQERGYTTDNLEDLFSDHPIAQAIMQDTVHILAMRLAHVVALLDPQMVVLGGIVVRIGGEPFIQAITEQVNKYLAPALTRPVSVVQSVLGTESIAVGALALALESLQE